MSLLSTFASSFKFDLQRYVRSPSLLFIALAAPIAAHYMVPDKDASYAVLTINGIKPVLTAPVLGLELGVLAATLLTPLAYIFLKAGPTRHRPWQITDVGPHSRMFSTLGRWASDTLALWILLAVLTIAGLILGIFRLEDKANIVQTIVALWLPAAPALAFIAATKLFLDARNFTRRWVGDVLFFMIWIGLMVLGIIGATDPQTQMMASRPLSDVFGFTAPIIDSVDYDVSAVTIGGASNSGESVFIEAWRGVTSSGYLSARLFWLATAAALAAFAGLIWAPFKPRSAKRLKAEQENVVGRSRMPIQDIPFNVPTTVAAGTPSYFAIIMSEVKLILRSRIWIIVLFVAAIIGALMPFRTLAGPAILLALIFPLTEASARWQSKTTGQFLNTLGPNRWERTGLLLAASIGIAAVTLFPSAIKAIIFGHWQWVPQMLAITILAPLVIVGTGAITRSSVTGRLLMLIVWYVYLSSASPV